MVNLSSETMNTRRNFLKLILAIAAIVITTLNFTPAALALGGQLPELDRPAPEFTLPTNTGDGEISLSDYRGQWVVLYFYPKDFTSGCTIEARKFQQEIGRASCRERV